MITSLILPEIKYLYTLKDLQIDEVGNLYHLLSYYDKVQIVKWNELASSKSSIINCLLYTSDAADERSSVDLGGRRIIKKKKKSNT